MDIAHLGFLKDEDFTEDPNLESNGGRKNAFCQHKRGFGTAQPYPAPRPRYWKPGALTEVASRMQMKRRRHSSGEGIKKQRFDPPLQKTSIQIVNEKFSGLVYTFSEPVGPSHNPTFNVSVVLPDGREFTSSGKSKKEAKNNVAAVILENLGEKVPQKVTSSEYNRIPLTPEAAIKMDTESNITAGASTHFPEVTEVYPVIDFASDDLIEVCLQRIPRAPAVDIHPEIIKRIVNIPNLHENAAAGLNSALTPEKALFDLISEEGPPHDRIFTTELHFVDQNKLHQSFIGKGCSKKKSKNDAAAKALISMIGEPAFYALVNRSQKFGPGEPQIVQPTEIISGMEGEENTDPMDTEYNIVLANFVRSLVLEKYEEIMTEDQAHQSQKVLAGVVMTRGFPLIENCTVVAITTGTKCIEGDCMSNEGLALNDCHAEVLATRCLRDYFYSQLEELCFEGNISDNTDCIFEIVHESEDGVEKIRLKDDIQFHLYISTSPCGDARIFSPKGLECEETEPEPPGDESDLSDAHPNRSNRGLLRAKIEAGEGTIPVANLNPGGIQTWDAILQGNALYTMSCSDKVCRWNVVGVQGALLSNFLEPVYYSSIILGSLHHPIHFERAVYGRVEHMAAELKHPFKLNKPQLLMSKTEVKRQVKKSPNHAIAWSYSWSVHEVLRAPKGRCWTPEVASRLSKRMQFLRFLKIYKNRTGRRENFANIYYSDAKALANDYQAALKKLKQTFQSNGLGNWISKPVEQDSFRIAK